MPPRSTAGAVGRFSAPMVSNAQPVSSPISRGSHRWHRSWGRGGGARVSRHRRCAAQSRHRGGVHDHAVRATAHHAGGDLSQQPCTGGRAHAPGITRAGPEHHITACGRGGIYPRLCPRGGGVFGRGRRRRSMGVCAAEGRRQIGGGRRRAFCATQKEPTTLMAYTRAAYTRAGRHEHDGTNKTQIAR